jgi:hypothetical protein
MHALTHPSRHTTHTHTHTHTQNRAAGGLCELIVGLRLSAAGEAPRQPTYFLGYEVEPKPRVRLVVASELERQLGVARWIPSIKQVLAEQAEAGAKKGSSHVIDAKKLETYAERLGFFASGP